MLDSMILDKIIKNALEEDIAWGDITADSTVPPDRQVSGRFVAKEKTLVCGMDVARRVFALIDPDVKINVLQGDGSEVSKGDVIAEIRGNARSVLAGERVALNFLQRMSGIAAKTRDCVRQVRGTKAQITDTRKTTPGLRILEKYAVRTGGGKNHRYNLADGVLIKDNHIRAAGGIRAAVDAARGAIPHTLKIEVEVEDFAMIEEALAANVDIIMLDNMSAKDMKKAVELIAGRALVEASGNMGDRDLKEIADTGVDIISIGALTHTVKSADISLRFV